MYSAAYQAPLQEFNEDHRLQPDPKGKRSVRYSQDKKDEAVELLNLQLGAPKVAALTSEHCSTSTVFRWRQAALQREREEEERRQRHLEMIAQARREGQEEAAAMLAQARRAQNPQDPPIIVILLALIIVVVFLVICTFALAIAAILVVKLCLFIAQVCFWTLVAIIFIVIDMVDLLLNILS